MTSTHPCPSSTKYILHRPTLPVPCVRSPTYPQASSISDSMSVRSVSTLNQQPIASPKTRLVSSPPPPFFPFASRVPSDRSLASRPPKLFPFEIEFPSRSPFGGGSCREARGTCAAPVYCVAYRIEAGYSFGRPAPDSVSLVWTGMWRWDGVAGG